MLEIKHRVRIWARKGRLPGLIQTSKANNALKPIINMVRSIGVPSIIRKNVYQDSFILIDISTGQAIDFCTAIPIKDGGGHFTFSKNGEWLINDCFPDANGNRFLFHYCLKET